MAAHTMRPDSDISTGWVNGSGSTNAEVNDSSDSSFIQSTAGSGTLSEFGFDAAPGDFSSLNTLTLRVRNRSGSFVDDNDTVSVSVWVSGVQQGGTKTINQNGSTITNDDFTDAAWDAFTAGDLNNMQVRVVHNKISTGMPDSARMFRIHEFEAILDYNTGPASTPYYYHSLTSYGTGMGS